MSYETVPKIVQQNWCNCFVFFNRFDQSINSCLSKLGSKWTFHEGSTGRSQRLKVDDPQITWWAVPKFLLDVQVLDLVISQGPHFVKQSVYSDQVDQFKSHSFIIHSVVSILNSVNDSQSDFDVESHVRVLVVSPTPELVEHKSHSAKLDHTQSHSASRTTDSENDQFISRITTFSRKRLFVIQAYGNRFPWSPPRSITSNVRHSQSSWSEFTLESNY